MNTSLINLVHAERSQTIGAYVSRLQLQ